MYGAARIRSELMKLSEYNAVEEMLLNYLESLKKEMGIGSEVSVVEV
jgi:hypothetical protein